MNTQLVKVAQTGEIPEGEARIFDADGISVVVCNVDGTFYAVENLCSHQDEEFEEGPLEGCQIECPVHSAYFDVTNGEPAGLPAVAPIETFPVTIEDDNVCIEL